MQKAAIAWNAKQVAKMYENDCLKFDNAVQRGDVWDKKRQSLLIDSMIKGYPVPPMFTIKTDMTMKDNRGRDVYVYDCIDGKQRCGAIKAFKSGELTLVGLDDDEYELNGKTYDDLDEETKDAFDSYGLTVYYFTDISDDEINEMMARLNNGKPLTNVETARIKAKDLDGLMKLASHELFEEYLTEAAKKSYHNEDIVIKSYIQLTEPDEPRFESKHTREIYTSVEFTEEITARLEGIFEKTREVISYIENNAPKKVFKKTIRKTNLLAIISLMESERSADEIAESVMAFFSPEDGTLSVSEDYNNASTNGTNYAPQVRTRNEQIAFHVTSEMLI